MAEAEQLHQPTNKYKSSVWKHFGFNKKDGNLDKTHAVCKICRGTIKYSGGMTNLTAHMKHRHSVSLETPASNQNQIALHRDIVIKLLHASFKVSYRWLCIEMRTASASVMKMHIPILHFIHVVQRTVLLKCIVLDNRS